jgi:hypothetical protein
VPNRLGSDSALTVKGQATSWAAWVQPVNAEKSLVATKASARLMMPRSGSLGFDQRGGDAANTLALLVRQLFT